MSIAGVEIILILGIVNIILVLLQVASGLHYIKLSFGVHRACGITLFFTASIHAALALLAS
jgi:hypothetical protein